MKKIQIFNHIRAVIHYRGSASGNIHTRAYEPDSGYRHSPAGLGLHSKDRAAHGVDGYIRHVRRRAFFPAGR